MWRLCWPRKIERRAVHKVLSVDAFKPTPILTHPKEATHLAFCRHVAALQVSQHG